jgi:lysyl endopeptidase
MKRILLTSIIILNALLGISQVKTKLFLEGLPVKFQNFKTKGHAVLNIKSPDELATLKDNNLSKEYSIKFAVPNKVSINLIDKNNLREEGNLLIYTLTIVAQQARNISLNLDSFHLSENALLSIFTPYELTDSITYDQNNDDQIWNTRVYQRDTITLNLTIPKDERKENTVHIGAINFGFKAFGQEFFGNPGSSASCNVNVVCPDANGWQNERNSVALIVAAGQEACTGSLVMNSCNTRTPYLLTANHCTIGSTVSNWVFQFQYWSPTCTPNGAGNESVQFNNCVLRANNAPSDFALVQLNTTPAVTSGLFYSGWNRNTTTPNGSVSIHHPAGDLMKFSRDLNISTVSSWGGTNNHWVSVFDVGTVEPGSSGAALYDMNHRIVGQLHGDQNNMGLYCSQRRGEFGKFDISWSGGGTNATRLSNWLDATNTNGMTSNTTNISDLFPTSITVSGPSYICNTTPQSYSVANLPPGASIIWTVNGGIAISGANNVNPVTIVRTTSGNSTATVTATVAGTCGNIVGSKSIRVNFAMPPFSLSTTCASQDATITFNPPAGTTINAAYEGGSTTTPLYQISTNSYILPASVFGVTVSMTNECGTGTSTKLIQKQSCRMGLSVSPNPAGNTLVLKSADQNNKSGFIREIQIVSKVGILKKKQTFSNAASAVSIDIANLAPDVYTIKAYNGSNWESIQFIKK